MTDPTLTEQLEMERLELEQMLRTEEEPVPADPLPVIKTSFVPNRHDRRRAEVIARRKSKDRKRTH